MAARADRVALAAFVAGAALAGGNSVAIRFSNRELDPLWGAGLRFALAALVLAALIAIVRPPVPRGRELRGALLYGILTFGGAFALAYYALVELHAGFGQILLALVPLATLVLAALQRQERLRLAGVVGSVLALSGVVVMSSGAIEGEVPLLLIAAAIGSALCFAQGAIVVRRFPPVHPIAMNVVGMAAGAALLVVGAVAAGETIELPRDAETWAAVGYLVTVGSVIVFILYLVVLARWTASRVSYEFVLIPFVTVALSARLDDEPVGIALALGGVLVLGGVYIGALRAAPEADSE